MANYPVSHALVGRAGEVSALLGAVADDRTHTVLIGGEAGIGKSRLVAEMVDRLGDRVVTLIGRCPEFGADGVPFAPFLAAMRALLRLRGVEDIAAVLPPAPALAGWLPALATRAGSGADTDRVRLFGEVLTLLEHVVVDQPVVLVLEDLHWIDDSSRALLTFLVANLADGDITLIGTYRPNEAGPARALISELRRNSGVLTISPEPLTQHQVGRQLAALLGREPEPELIAKAFDRSGGNPLFVEALSHATEEIPAGLTELLLSFQAGLSAEARAVLRVAAVIGSPVAHELLAVGTELSQPSLYVVLKELVDRQLLLTANSGYEFRHVLIRQATYDDMLPIERTRMHARLADALRADPDLLPAESHSAELAHHAMAAGDLSRALAASWQAAAIATRDAAHPEALRHLERVLDLWDRVPTQPGTVDATKLTVLEQIIEVASRSGVIDRGIVAADAALALVDVDAEPRRAAQLHYRRAYLANRTGAGPGADLDRALQLLPTDPPDALRGEILAQRAASHVFNGNAAGAATDAHAAIGIADELGASALSAFAYANLGLATSDQFDIADSHFATAHAIASAAEDPAMLIDVAAWRSTVLLVEGRYRDGIAVIQEGLRVAHESFRFTSSAPILLVKWAQALTALGRWEQARDVVEDSKLEQLPLSRAASLMSVVAIALAQGDQALALSSAEEAEQLLGGGQWARPYRLQLKALQCQMAMDAGDHAAAARVLAEATAPDDIAETLSAHPHVAWPLLVLAARVPGAPTDMLALADSLAATSAVDAAHRAVFFAYRDPTVARWDAAAALWQGLEQPYEQAQALLAAGQAQVAEGNRAAAVAALNAADDLAAALDAKPLLHAVEQIAQRARLILDRLPAESPKSPGDRGSASSFGLTPRELDVLRLVARGMSNRQLAAELFISTNTAGVHVSRILTKLSVASRTEAAAFAHQHHLLEGE